MYRQSAVRQWPICRDGKCKYLRKQVYEFAARGVFHPLSLSFSVLAISVAPSRPPSEVIPSEFRNAD